MGELAEVKKMLSFTKPPAGPTRPWLGVRFAKIMALVPVFVIVPVLMLAVNSVPVRVGFITVTVPPVNVHIPGGGLQPGLIAAPPM